jgi:hypothetical protein
MATYGEIIWFGNEVEPGIPEDLHGDFLDLVFPKISEVNE